MNSLGIYFGPKAINIVETKGRELLNSFKIAQSTISLGELEEKVSADVKAGGIASLVKDELKKNRIETKEAILCLSGKELIIRTFEIPTMPQEELQSAINFEVKKYIPFKVEDLISDFQIAFDRSSRTNLVLFMGIKKDTQDKYISLLSQLDITINAIEYSAFSILRILKLSGFSDKGIIGILGVDLTGEDEVNFTVLENGFPLFSRDIILAGAAEEFDWIKEKGSDKVLEKLKTEIRVSLDYYRRKFSMKSPKKIYLFSDVAYHLNLEAIMKEIGLTVQFIDASICIDKLIPYSLSFIKGYSASLSKTLKTKVKVDLLKAKEKRALPKKGIISTEARSMAYVFKGLKLNHKVLTYGLLIYIITVGFGILRTVPLRKELNKIINMRAKVTTVNPEITYEELSNITSTYREKLSNLENFLKNQLYLTTPLEVIPRAIPTGMWLTNFSFNRQQENKAQLILEGTVYLDDSDKEFETLNKFLAKLKEDPEFSKYFKDINITAINRAHFENVTVTDFSIICNAY